MNPGKPEYRCAETVMFRTPLRPLLPAPSLQPTTDGATVEPRDLTNWIRALIAGDPVLREAVQVSSPSLARVLHQVMSGEEPRPRGSRRAARALARYLLRMCTRSTPFGLLAGVGLASIGTEASVRWKGEHRTTSSVDLGWLDTWVRRCEREPVVLAHLQVTVNNLCRVQGDRLVLPNGRTARSDPAVVSVHLSTPVRTVMDTARSPVPYREVRDELRRGHREAAIPVVDSLLQRMVDLGLLLTQLPPPPGAPDPTGHVVSVLEGLPESALPPDVAADLDRLRRVRQDLALYDRQPVGAGLHLLVSAQRHLRGMESVTTVGGVQVDLALDADIRIPRLVAAEAQFLAGALTRLSAPFAPPLHDFHQRFVSRYGVNTLVPLTDVVDPTMGLAPPRGYRSARTGSRQAAVSQENRDRFLASLAQEATLLGRDVVLDETHVDELAGPGPHLPPPTEVELCAHVLASSPDDLKFGAFRLAVASAFGSPTIGAMTGRFAHLFQTGDGVHRAPLIREAPTSDPTPLHARLVFPPLQPRSANILRGPEWRGHDIPLGIFADPADPRVLDPEDLFVTASDHRLHVHSSSLQREVTPVGFHALNYRSQAPDIARLLREVSLSGTRPWQPWNWGSAAHLPHLPRVCYRKSILAPARWRVPSSLREAGLSVGQWRSALERWRDTWGVPTGVQVLAPQVTRDRGLVLDLEAQTHQRLFREEVLRHPEVVVTEDLFASPEATGWLAGHSNEVVFPLVLSGRPPTPPRADPMPLITRSRDLEHLPGGTWLSARIACAPEHISDVVGMHLPALVDGLPIDEWYFVRYDDPHSHLRLRFHGAPHLLNSAVLPRLHGWAVTLRRSGLVDRLELGAYNPEVGRYGTGAAMAAAERTFCADSRSVLAQLRYLASDREAIPPVVLAAANLVDIVYALQGSGGASWLSDLSKPRHRRLSRAHRDIALELITPDTHWSGLRGTSEGEAVVASWGPRREALREYGTRLAEARTGSLSREEVLPSLLHMHANRLLGIDPESEAQSLDLARAALRAQESRVHAP